LGAGEGGDGVCHRLELGMLLGQAHDLSPVRSRGHARLDLPEAVEHLFEPGLGESQGAGLSERLHGALALRAEQRPVDPPFTARWRERDPA
jgi:hypothetical protein